MRFPFTALLLIASTIALAAEEPRIKIVKSSKLDIAITGLTGADLDTLRRDLVNSGYFAVTGADQAQYTAKGSGGGELQGTLSDREGKTTLNKTYAGTGRDRIHRFADDIVETLTGDRPFLGNTLPELHIAILQGAFHLKGDAAEIGRLEGLGVGGAQKDVEETVPRQAQLDAILRLGGVAEIAVALVAGGDLKLKPLLDRCRHLSVNGIAITTALVGGNPGVAEEVVPFGI